MKLVCPLSRVQASATCRLDVLSSVSALQDLTLVVAHPKVSHRAVVVLLGLPPHWVHVTVALVLNQSC